MLLVLLTACDADVVAAFDGSALADSLSGDLGADAAPSDGTLPDAGVADSLICQPATSCISYLPMEGGLCGPAHKASGTKCNDGKLTTKGDTCDGKGGCAGTVYSCSPGQCEASSVPNGVGCTTTPKVSGAKCNDGNAGTIKDACDGKGGCKGQLLPTKGLVAYFPFSGNAQDTSGTGNHGTVHGAILTTDRFGVAKRAYVFNGTSDYISVKDHVSLHFNDFTFTAWVKLTSTAGGRYLLEKDVEGTGTADYEWLLSSGKVVGRIGIAWNNWDVASKQSVADGTWHFIVSRRSGSQLSVWIDGVQEGSLTTPTGKVSGSGEQLTIGSGWQGAGYFAGAIDDLRIYNRALTTQEILTLSSHK